MEIKEDTSYGIIPVVKEGEKWRVLLIKQYSHIGNNTYWGFPKGHVEEGEAPRQTAVRELREETNMEVGFFEETSFNNEYSFIFNGVKITKKVIFFIGFVKEIYFKVDTKEVKEAKWFNLDEAMERLDYKNTKEMFANVIKYIKAL